MTLYLNFKRIYSQKQRSSVPAWAWNLVCRIPSHRWQQICDSDKTMAEVSGTSCLRDGNMHPYINEQFVGGRLCDMQAKVQSGEVTKDTDTRKMPLLERMLHYISFSPATNLTRQDILSEAIGHLCANL